MRKNIYINNAGFCIVSNNILNGNGLLKWLLREHPVRDKDNGWRFFSDIDDNDFINDPANMSICDFNDVADIEPAIVAIYTLPIGSDIQLIVENNIKTFWDNITDTGIDTDSLYQ